MLPWIPAAVCAYVLLSLAGAVALHRLPREPVRDAPGWGCVQDLVIPAAGKGYLELWRVIPEKPLPLTAVFVHGLTRNRDMMTPRARVFGALGATTVMASARDHGGSSPHALMDVNRLAEDVDTVVSWVGEPVILYGHSAGAGAAMLFASRRPDMVRALVLESAYPYPWRAFVRFMASTNPVAGRVFGPGVVAWMEILHQGSLARSSPLRLAGELSMPVLLIHGDEDEKFPLSWARRLKRAFPRACLFVARGAGHADCPRAPGYEAAVRSFLADAVGLGKGFETPAIH
ncbi:MAG: alpha/beta fold hydrolase [Deltaproteobacteria bacterium]|nr:alpha/beta fold hydrolase [Deltaproteobacteria bacterium]